MHRCLSALTLALTALTAHAQVAPATAKARATQLLDHLDQGDYAAAHALFDATMQKSVPLPVLSQVWRSLPAAGPRGAMRLHREDAGHAIEVPLQRGDQDFEALIRIGSDGRIAGFLIRPAPKLPPIPAIAADAAFEEIETTIGTGEAVLPATLAMPKGQGPFPAVVLVHGSGPADRHETTGANRPFLDIARGLAAQGVAVLRYEKRSMARPGDLAGPLSIDTETTDDALRAVERLRQQPGIDRQRLFVLGHSQGGMMAPRIGQRDPAIAGLILLAAPARNLLDILIEQNERLLGMQGEADSAAGRAHMARLRAQLAEIRSGGNGQQTGMPFDLPASYWRSVDAVDPLAEAKASRQPLLILHGGHDIQVVEADWQAWRQGLGASGRATFRHYPRLNHLGIESAPGAGLESYDIPGQVDAGLITDIARWIQQQP